MVLSRSPSNEVDVESDIFLWSPILPLSRAGDVRPSSEYNHIWTFSQERAYIWFLRFRTDSLYRVLACGNCQGDISLWDMSAKSSKPFSILSARKKRKGAVRWLTFSPKDDFVVAVCDDGSIWVWEIQLPEDLNDE